MNSSILSKLYELVKILESPDDNFYKDMSILLTVLALFGVRNRCSCFKNECSQERKNWIKTNTPESFT